MLSHRCLSCRVCPFCLSVLSVTLVYCGQTVRSIKMKLGDEWTLNLDLGGQIDCVYMDFEKAFDKVAHRRLIWLVNYIHMELTVR